jgi:hypothetical protein
MMLLPHIEPLGLFQDSFRSNKHDGGETAGALAGAPEPKAFKNLFNNDLSP